MISICVYTFACSNGNGKVDSNPFEEEEEWDEADNVLVDNGEPGVPVKALYDYEGAESDELTFKQGAWHGLGWRGMARHGDASNAEAFHMMTLLIPLCFALSGDVFEKLEDEDEQGWCKGRMNGRVGLYPANYVENINA